MKQSPNRKSKALSNRQSKHFSNPNRKSNASSVAKSYRSSSLNQNILEQKRESKKIPYSNQIRQNRGSTENFLETKKRSEASGKRKQKTNQEISSEYQFLKRSSIGKSNLSLVEELNDQKKKELNPIEYEIIEKFSAIRLIANRCPSIIVHPVIQELGTYKKYRVSKVAIELSECHELFGERKYGSDGKIKNVIEHAIFIQADTGSSKQLQKPNNLKIDKYVRVYLAGAAQQKTNEPIKSLQKK